MVLCAGGFTKAEKRRRELVRSVADMKTQRKPSKHIPISIYYKRIVSKEAIPVGFCVVSIDAFERMWRAKVP